jgi:hypothetical protein
LANRRPQHAGPCDILQSQKLLPVLALAQVLGLELLAPPTARQISQRPLLSWFLCLALFTSFPPEMPSL